MLEFLVDTIFVVFMGKVPADSWYSNGNQLRPSSSRHISPIIRSRIYTVFDFIRQETVGISVQFTYRYIDDVLSINNPEFEIYLMYLFELEIKDTTDSNTSASYFNLLQSIGRDGPTSYFHLWQAWRFQFPYNKLCVPEYLYTSLARLWRLYLTAYTICSGLLLVWIFFFWGRHDFQIKTFRTGIRRRTLEIVIEEVLCKIRGSFQTIWISSLTNAQWHSVTWPNTMTTLHQ